MSAAPVAGDAIPRERPAVARRRRRVLPAWLRRLDRRIAAGINATAAPAAVDGGLRLLTRSADRGRLWFGLAGLLLLGGRRRAALRGLLSLAGASILANLVGKQLFGGDRPLLDDIPVGRRLRANPSSGSFPSGHSASAAAFAAGVAVEYPAAGAAIAPLAIGVAYSRMHVGAHWASDVVGGSALGLGVAALGRLLVGAPRPVRRVAAVPPAAEARLPALPEGAGLLVIANPASGRGRTGRDPLDLLLEQLPSARIHRLRRRDRIERIVRRALRSRTPPIVLGVSGGDGTVGAVAHQSRLAGLPLLVLPGGTYNHFAGAAGIADAAAAVRALQRGSGQRVDVAELVVGEREPITVLNTASVGVYPEFVAARERRERRWGRMPSALLAATEVIGGAEPLLVALDGGPGRPVWSVFIGVGRYSRRSIAPLRRRRLDDGVLDLRILRARADSAHGGRMRGIAGLALRPGVTGRLHRLGFWADAPVVERRRVEELRLRVAGAGAGLRVAHDGESAPAPRDRRGGVELRMRLLPAGLAVYAPWPRRRGRG